jgi:hypothetical protein
MPTRRVATKEPLKTEIAAWERQHNASDASIKWMFWPRPKRLLTRHLGSTAAMLAGSLVEGGQPTSFAAPPPERWRGGIFAVLEPRGLGGLQWTMLYMWPAWGLIKRVCTRSWPWLRVDLPFRGRIDRDLSFSQLAVVANWLFDR